MKLRLFANVHETIGLKSVNTLLVYLEKPDHGEEERDNERHRQVREWVTADNHADRLEKRR